MKLRLIAPATILVFAVMPLLARPQAQPGQPAAQAQNQPKPKSQPEVDALRKVQAAYTAKDWDAAIQAINNVLENFPDTEFKNQLLNMAVQAAATKNDYAQTVVYGEKALQADPNNVAVEVLLADDIAQHTREHDLDKEQSLKKAEDYANKALALLKNPSTPPPPGVPDAEWPQYRKQLTGQAYDALGQAAALRKKFPDAIEHYKTSLSNDENPTTMARMAKAYLDNKQYDEAIAEADKVLAMNDVPAVVKTFAQQQKEAAAKLKAANSNTK